MQHENFAMNYDVFLGKPTQAVTHYNEIHTGNLWSTACDYFYSNDPYSFPLGLVCFYDKTHTDVFGSLSRAPFIATILFFKKTSQNNHKFYAVLGYVPNLTYGHGRLKSKKTVDKLKDKHKCLRLITDQIENLNKYGGFHTYILGKKVTVKTWIHFIAGDTSAHNNLIGQYNSSNAIQPYRDFHCLLKQLSNSSPKCALITIEE